MSILKTSRPPHPISRIARLAVVMPCVERSASEFPNQKSKIKNQKSAFTLIELLVVIAIIAILVGIVLGGAAIGTALAHKSRAQAERDALISAIDSYKAKRGSYPPCNVSNTTRSSLFYELTGAISSNANNSTTFQSPVSGESFTANGTPPGSVAYQFGTGGINNASPDPTEIKNYYPNMKNDQHGALYQKGISGPTYSLMILSVHGPNDFPSGGSQIYNFWNYVSSENAIPLHNKDSYDLWVDILVHGKTYRVSNWSKDPELVND